MDSSWVATSGTKILQLFAYKILICLVTPSLIKKKIKLSSVAKSHMANGLLNSHIWLNICAVPHILRSPSSYMTLQLLHSEFPFIRGKFGLIYQCSLAFSVDVALVIHKPWVNSLRVGGASCRY